jgi:tetratricopeptide (TPR) repeat protein
MGATSIGWAGEYGALAQQDDPTRNDTLQTLLDKQQTLSTTSFNTPLSSSSNRRLVDNSCDCRLHSEEAQYTLISSSRLERLFRSLQNVTKSVAMHVLECVEDDLLYDMYCQEFTKWNVSQVARQLRCIFKNNRNRTNDDSDDDGASPTKRRRTNEHYQVEQERDFVRQRVKQYLEELTDMESTSFDDVNLAIVESFRYHPSVAFKLMRSALEKNKYNYVVYFHAMELYRQTGSKLDCVKELRYGKFMMEDEIAQVEMELSVEKSRSSGLYYTDELITILEHDLLILKGLNRVFDGLIHFFSDSSAEDMFRLFSEALEFDPSSVYSYTNLGVLNGFNINGSSDTCLSGIQLLEKALELCNEGNRAVLAGFLYHTIAQSYMRLGRTEDALQNLDRTLEVNPTMILACFDKASILRASNDLTGALIENDTLLQICPENPFELSNIYCNRAVLHYKLRQEKAMYEAVNKSMAIDPCNSFPYIMLSKQAILRNDRKTFEQLKDIVTPREHMHITHYLQHLIEAYAHFDSIAEMKKYQTLYTNYEGSWNRID